MQRTTISRSLPSSPVSSIAPYISWLLVLATLASVLVLLVRGLVPILADEFYICKVWLIPIIMNSLINHGSLLIWKLVLVKSQLYWLNAGR